MLTIGTKLALEVLAIFSMQIWTLLISPKHATFSALSLSMFYHMGCYHGHEFLATSVALVLLCALIMLSVETTKTERHWKAEQRATSGIVKVFGIPALGR